MTKEIHFNGGSVHRRHLFFCVAAEDSKVMTSSSTTSVTKTEAATTPATEMKWTELQGKATRVDLQTKVIQIKEDSTDTLVVVPVDDSVAIYKHGHHKYALGDIQVGDSVTLRHNS